MKCLATALALSFAFSTVAAPVALAQEPATQFRSAEARTFTTVELQQYGLSADDAAQVASYQDQGYEVVVLTPEEAAQYQAGITTTQWLLIGLVVVVIAVAVSN